MKNVFRPFNLLFLLPLTCFFLTAFIAQKQNPGGKFPYQQAGLNERQAAAHLLNRFTFGATPGQVDEVVKMGLEKWLEQQLRAQEPDKLLNNMLDKYETLKMSNQDIVRTFPKGGQILRRAIKDGVINDSAVRDNRKDYRKDITAYMQANGYKPQAELFRQLINQKILRARYSNNQLQELLTDFWFNHFNVSLTKNDCAQFVTAYERDAIRANALGRFETILMATAKSPAMLTYLDNFRSSSANTELTPAQKAIEKRAMKVLEERQAMDPSMQKTDVVEKVKKAKQAQGLNENYAREIMELHTLGVDGGYTQSDVTQAAKVLTGWTIYPMENEQVVRQIERLGEERFKKQGFVREGDFLFAANKHDKGEKKVLGQVFPANGGYEEGVRLIGMLAHHPSTARFIATKLAVRFVSDNPPKSLVDKMAKTFTEKDGDIREVLLTMVNAPEFWSKEAIREKTKSPFELAISSVRSLNADIDAPFQLYTWITKMGEKMYYYQAPTGFPDKGQYWINTGSLLNRMNFGLALASQRIPGISFNLAALNGNREPESAEEALLTYGKLLMPERDLEATVKRLQPLLSDPELSKKVDAAAGKTSTAQASMIEQEDELMMDERDKKSKPAKEKVNKKNNDVQMSSAKGNNSLLGQVVGIIIGSPEFQRK